MKMKNELFALYMTSQLGLLSGLCLFDVVNATMSDDLAIQEFQSYPTYEARSYVPYENQEREYALNDLILLHYKDDLYLVDHNLDLIGSEGVSFSVVENASLHNHDKQVLATDMFLFSSFLPMTNPQEICTVVEAYNCLDLYYDDMLSFFEEKESDIVSASSKNMNRTRQFL